MTEGKITLSAEGISDTTAYLDRVANFDVAASEQEAAMRLLPQLRRFTRVRTGELSRGWDASDGAFINMVPYAVPQEYGSKYVDPMGAIDSAVLTGEKDIVGAFEDGINKEIT